MPMLNARSARGLRKRPFSREPEPAQSVMQGNPTTISTKAITGTSNAMCPGRAKLATAPRVSAQAFGLIH